MQVLITKNGNQINFECDEGAHPLEVAELCANTAAAIVGNVHQEALHAAQAVEQTQAQRKELWTPGKEIK